MPRYTYSIQAHYEHIGWFTLGGCTNVPRTWASGFLAGRREASRPQLPLRVLRSDGKVVDETSGSEDVEIGLVAGWPSAEQYEQAAARALGRADHIRQHEARKKGMG